MLLVRRRGRSPRLSIATREMEQPTRRPSLHIFRRLKPIAVTLSPLHPFVP